MALALGLPTDASRPRILARRALALTWSLAFEQAELTAAQAAGAIAAAEGNVAAAEFLADVADAMWGVASIPRAWSVATQGLRYLAGRRDTTWARLMVHDIERRDAVDPEFPGIPISSAEREEVMRLLWEMPAFRHLGQRMFAYMAFDSRDDVLARAGDDPMALVFWAGEYRKALPLLEQATRHALERGQISLAICNLSLVARVHCMFGDFASSMSIYGRMVELYARANDPPWLRSVNRRRKLTLNRRPILTHPGVRVSSWSGSPRRSRRSRRRRGDPDRPPGSRRGS
jgi:hypothetical protein